ncbi:MAG: hypothetical protein KDJ17_05120 [Hyphomicrobiaceae bacterium]|nr:hypothetical protein [Hyphomicrobiaceae bacterium]
MERAVAQKRELQHPRAPGGQEALAAALALAGEAIVVLLAFSADVAFSVVLLVHAMIVAGVGFVLLSRRRGEEDRSLAIVLLFLVAVAGPAGAMATLAALPFAGNVASTQDVRGAWYERLARAGRPSHVTQLYDRIVSGRVQRLDASAPGDFLKVITQGTLDERQRALGLVARHFHPDYTPVLDAALRSSEPVVRVQAAAVVARVREDLKVKVEALCTSSAHSLQKTLHDAGELNGLSTCPLVTLQLQARCRHHMCTLLNAVLIRGRDVSLATRLADKDALHAMETFFIDEARFKELRVLRRVARASAGGLRRVRRRGAMEAAAT